MSESIKLNVNEKFNDLTLEEVMKRVNELPIPKIPKIPKMPKIPKGKKLSKAQLKKIKVEQEQWKLDQEELKKLTKECAELNGPIPMTDFDRNIHPFEQRSDKFDVIAAKTFMKKYLENVYRRMYNLSSYQLAVVDHEGNMVMTSINTDAVLLKLIEMRQEEVLKRKQKRIALDKALQENR